MRKLFFVLICLLLSSVGASQTYRVSFYQNTPVYFSTSKPTAQRQMVNSFIDDNGNIFYIGNYEPTGNSFIKKFNSKGEEILTYNFPERVFISYAQSEYAVATGKLVKTPLNQFLLVCQKNQDNAICQRVICFDSNFQILWEVTAPANPQGVAYLIKDISFDESNNIYLLADVGYNSSLPPAYTHVYLYKYTSGGSLLWQKTINTSPFGLTYNKIVKMKTNSFVIAITRASQYKNYFTLYEIDKATGNTLKYNLYTDNPSYIAQFDCKELNGSYYLGYTTDLMPEYQPHHVLRKYNSALDSVWSKKDDALSTLSTVETDNSGHVFLLGNPYAAAYDTNGTLWWKTSTFSSINSLKTTEGFALTRSESTMPAFTNIGFNGGILSNSEVYNPANQSLNSRLLYQNPLNNLQYISAGEVQENANQKYLYYNNFDKNGTLTYSATEQSVNDAASDFKYFNSYLYISGTSRAKTTEMNAFVNKYTSAGVLQWTANIYSGEKSVKITNIAPTPTAIYAGGELFDSVTNRKNGFLAATDNNGNVTFKFSFKNLLPKESSVKFVQVNNSSADVFIAGQYLDSTGKSKIFIAKNTGNENVWIQTLNQSAGASDSLVSFFIDQFNNGYISYNCYESGISTKYIVYRFNSNGNPIFMRTMNNLDGVYLKKTIHDGFGYIYNLSSNKGSTYFDLLTEKLDSNGAQFWTDLYTSNVDYKACDLVTDLNTNLVVTANFLNAANKTDVLTMKIRKDGERMWNKVYNSGNKFQIIKISADDLWCYYLSGISIDAAGNKTHMLLEYDKDGNQRYTTNYNERDAANLLSFSDDYFACIVTNVEAGQKKMFTLSNVNRVNSGSDIKLNTFSSYIVAVEKSGANITDSYSLSQNYPNPFNPSTIINYQLPKNSFISLNVYDANGRLIKILENGNKPAGNYSANFSAEGLSSGVYYYNLVVDGVVFDTKKAVVMK
ncbi:MAG: T9SS type A sorting domain-containing protein [Bacteroidetes bacterium]|nr:T9SS type A sorting domain-containing protein [Bacteroidota bacterium]